MTRSGFLLFFLMNILSIPVLSNESGHIEPVNSITIEELRDHIYFLASDYLDGRVPGQEGYSIASAYVASQFRAAGLNEITGNAAERSGFLMKIPVIRRSLRNFRLDLSTPVGGESFPLGEKFKIQVFDYSLEPGGRWPLVFAGYGISESQVGWNDLEGLDLEGKAVVLLRGAPARKSEPALPPALDERYKTPRSIIERALNIAKSKPAAIIIPASSRFLEQWIQKPDYGSWPREVLLEKEGPFYYWINADLPGFMLLGTNLFVAKNDLINELFSSAGYQPFLEDGAVNEDGYRSFEAESTFIEPSYEFADEEKNSPNVISMVEGTDPALRNEYIVIGAHLDHLERIYDQVMNGADDNASGVAGLIEIAEAIAMDPPRRSVIFVAFTEEETGLLGSRYFVENCPVPLDRVVACVNLDMIGRTHQDLQATGGIYVSGADRTCIECWEALREVNGKTEKLDLRLQETLESVNRSDQLHFFRNGIPTIGFESGVHPDTHQPTDDPEKIEFDKVRKVSRLVYEFVSAMANAEKRPCGTK